MSRLSDGAVFPGLGRRIDLLHRLPIRAIACGASAMFGIAFTVASFYPGYLSSDSIDQLEQARSGVFNDWHPPVMGLVWRLTDQIIPGPLGMLILNNLLFWSGVALICYHCLGKFAPPAIVALGLFPPVFGLLGTVWKDVAFGASMIFAFALLLHAQLARSKAAWVFAILPIFYALGLRHNSAPAVVALTLYSGWVFTGVFRLGSWRTAIAIGATGFILLFAGVTLLNRQLTGGRQAYVLQTVLLHDLTAISLAEHRVLVPGWLRRNGSAPTLDQLERMYQPVGVVPLFVGDPEINFETTTDPVAVARLAQIWRSAVYHYPRAYARHRLNVFRLVLGTKYTCYPYQEGISPNSLGIQVRPSSVNAAVMHVLAALGSTLFFKPWIYVSAIGLMLISSLWVSTSFRIPLLTIGTSALLYEAAYLLLGPGCDFRLSWYVVLAALVMPPLLIAARRFAPPSLN